jgi:hypothetical protein
MNAARTADPPNKICYVTPSWLHAERGDTLPDGNRHQEARDSVNRVVKRPTTEPTAILTATAERDSSETARARPRATARTPMRGRSETCWRGCSSLSPRRD